jgi:hypothetical protein
MRYPALLRKISLLRLPAMLLLVLAMLATPVLAAVGDLHEVGHSEVADGTSQGVDDHDNEGEHEEGDLLHALMHAAHCCSHIAAVFDGVSLACVYNLMTKAQQPERIAPSQAPRSSVFRPPIAV